MSWVDRIDRNRIMYLIIIENKKNLISTISHALGSRYQYFILLFSISQDSNARVNQLRDGDYVLLLLLCLHLDHSYYIIRYTSKTSIFGFYSPALLYIYNTKPTHHSIYNISKSSFRRFPSSLCCP